MKKLIKNKKGQGLTEYLILLVLVSITAIGVTITLGKTVREKIKTAREHINSGVTFPDRSNYGR